MSARIKLITGSMIVVVRTSEKHGDLKLEVQVSRSETEGNVRDVVVSPESSSQAHHRCMLLITDFRTVTGS